MLPTLQFLVNYCCLNHYIQQIFYQICHKWLLSWYKFIMLDFIFKKENYWNHKKFFFFRSFCALYSSRFLARHLKTNFSTSYKFCHKIHTFFANIIMLDFCCEKENYWNHKNSFMPIRLFFILKDSHFSSSKMTFQVWLIYLLHLHKSPFVILCY